MLPNKSILKINENSRMPIYLQFSNGIIKLILNGTLYSGLKLPGSRTMANHYSVHRKTIVNAYEELESQGWLETIPAKGSFISKKLPIRNHQKFKNSNPSFKSNLKRTHFELKDKFPTLNQHKVPKSSKCKYAFDDGVPDLRLAPIQALGRQYKSLLNSKFASKKLSYSDDLKGNIQLRTELVKYLSETRSIQVSPENILIVRGSVMGFYLLFQIILDKGDNVIVGETNFHAANQIIKNAGGNLIL